MSSEDGLQDDSDNEQTQLSPISEVGDENFEDQSTTSTSQDHDVNTSSNSDTVLSTKEHKNIKAPTKRKKSTTRLEKSLETVIDKFMEGQKEMEARYLELEEKRIKFEHDIEKSRLQMEERRLESERKHEMNMWMMIMQGMGRGYPSYYPSQHSPQQPYPIPGGYNHEFDTSDNS